MSRATAAAAPIQPVALKDALSERYLAYALSTITARSLPDVRDGLKPVQRRILYAMLQLRLDPAGGFKKCARVVGDVIGKFHPHGDVAVYDALVRLAQDFAQRYPLVDGQGNFGNIDGDNPAAMRYTESRLTAVAMALLEGIDEDAVDFRDNYDGSDERAGGAAGGVPEPAGQRCLRHRGRHGDQHPAAQCRRAALGPGLDGGPVRRRAARPTVEELLRHVQGPDLPTGGWLVEPAASIAEAYRTGRGSFRLRARWEKEELAYGQYQVVVTEIPYQVQKGRLIERMAELLTLKKLPLLGDLRDELTEAVRLVLVPRSRAVTPELLMEQLFRLTELEVRLLAQHERARRRRRAARDEPGRGARGLSGAPHGGAGPPLAPPAGQGRGPARGPGGLPQGVPRPRRGDPDHPRGGRAQAGADGALRADRPAGRGDPQPAPAQPAQARGDGARGRAGAAERRARGRSWSCWPTRAKPAPGAAEGAVPGGQEAVRRRRRWASGAPASPRRR